MVQGWGCLVWRREGLGRCPQCTKYLKGKRTRAKFLSVVPSEKSRSNGHEERFGSFPLKSGNSDVREAEHGHRLPMQVVESPSLGTFRSHLGMFLSNQPLLILL